MLEVLRNLEKSLQEEVQAQQDYAARALQALAAGDPATAGLYHEIQGEEAHHESELRARIRQLQAGAASPVQGLTQVVSDTVNQANQAAARIGLPPLPAPPQLSRY